MIMLLSIKITKTVHVYNDLIHNTYNYNIITVIINTIKQYLILILKAYISPVFVSTSKYRIGNIRASNGDVF